jgi:hypothetical protein
MATAQKGALGEVTATNRVALEASLSIRVRHSGEGG